jgi:hypothetical protein
MEKNEVGWTCGINGEGEIHIWIKWGNLKYTNFSVLNG